eukprot:scaffold10319_cov51-Phaeocystis_antarctica.AAC.4
MTCASTVGALGCGLSKARLTRSGVRGLCGLRGLGLLDPAPLDAVLAMEGGAPVVLYRVVGAAGQQLGDLSPPVAHLHVALEQDAVLLLAPGVSGQAVVELVVPPLAALLAVPPGHVLRDLRPLLCTVLLDERTQPPILLDRPGLAVVLRLGVVLPARRAT